MGFEVTDFWGLAGLAGRHIHRGFRESVRGPNCEFSKIETAKPVDKALEGRRMHPFTAAEDGFDPSKVEPGQVVIYCFCCRQFEGEVRCRRKTPGPRVPSIAATGLVAAETPPGL